MSQPPPSPQPSSGRASYFPRARRLPPQSPLFWVEQKDRYLRQSLIRDIEETTGRRLVVYFANRYEIGSEIQSTDIAHLAEILTDIASDPVDLLLETPGGQTDATEALISLIRNSITDHRVIVANAAKSNGTLLALAAKTILMRVTSELGPIEPSIQGIPCSILDTEEFRLGNFPLYMYGQYAQKQSRSLAKMLLETGMMAGKPPHEIEATVDALAGRNKYHSHGSVVDHVAANKLGLNVTYMPNQSDLWRQVRLLHCMLDFDSRRNGFIKIFEGCLLSLSVAAPPANRIGSPEFRPS